MVEIILRINSWLEASKTRYWSILTTLIIALAVLMLRLDITEDVSAFFPKSDKEAEYVLSHLKAMDRISIIVEKDSAVNAEAELPELTDAAELCAAHLEESLAGMATTKVYYGDEEAKAMMEYVYAHLPELLTDEDYAHLRTMLNADSIREQMTGVAQTMRTPAASFVAPIVSRDPLMMGMPVLQRLQRLSNGNGLQVTDGYLTSEQGDRVLIFVDLNKEHAATENNEALADSIANIVRQQEAASGVKIHAYGAPLVTVENSRRVKKDEMLTMSIALSIIMVVMYLTFGRLRSVILLIVPVAFGGLFAIAIISATGHALSQIAIGTGATIMGLTFSYSIHMLTEGLNSSTPQEMLKRISKPMVVGSLTTVGAFMTLTMTNSQVLRDLGIFATLTIVGCIVFSLTFLPHLMEYGKESSGRTLSFIERAANFDYANHRLLVLAIGITFIVSLFYMGDVRFNTDMSALNYKGNARMQEAYKAVEETFGVGGHRTQMVVTGTNLSQLAENAHRFEKQANETPGVLQCQTMATALLPTDADRERRVAQWNEIWTPEKKEQVIAEIRICGEQLGFAEEAFDDFYAMLDTRPASATTEELIENPMFGEWLSQSDSLLMLYCNIETEMDTRDETLSRLSATPSVISTDMGYYSRNMAKTMVEDFNWLLILSSVIVAIGLLMSYGRIELVMISFLPMAISWVIISGLMGIFGIEFNVVNSILSTFIFGVGDDFSIFTMDGLQAEYTHGESKTMQSHKTAIWLSGFAAIAGLGSQALGQHPAIHSLGMISIFGLLAVIICSNVVQPIMFDLLIRRPAQVGYPHTLTSLLRTTTSFALFGIMSLGFQVVMLMVMLVERSNAKRRKIIHKMVYGGVRLLTSVTRPRIAMPDIKVSPNEPSIIVANHQSMIDIMSMMSISPYIVFVVKPWVVYSPIMGRLARAMGFYSIDEGNGEAMTERLRKLADEGYSIVVFPEGTRTSDGEIRKFHKGAFVLAKQLGLKIRPMVFYGNDRVVSRNQTFRIMNGLMRCHVMDEMEVGSNDLTSKEMTNRAQAMMRNEMQNMRKTYDPANNFFAEALQMGYIYRDARAYAEVKRLLASNELAQYADMPTQCNVVVRNAGNGAVAYWIALHGEHRNVVAYCDNEEEKSIAENSLLRNRVAERGATIEFRLSSAAEQHGANCIEVHAAQRP